MPILLRRVVPFAFWYVLLIVSAIVLDLFQHRLDLFWVGRYLGICGTILLVLSFAYSLRKRKIINFGSPKVGCLADGRCGREPLHGKIPSPRGAGSREEIDKKLFLDSLTVDLMENWRHVHLPLTAIFAAFATLHIVSILVLWKW